ncbi:MAG: MFS transporter [Candidatus Alcyoniella australis]|nr:MFS transporter [Candidatus Alcyoniella australis]
MEPPATPALGTRRRLLYSSGELGLTLTPAVVGGWLIYFYTGGENPSRALVTTAALGLIVFLSRIGEVVSNPLIGFYSDRIRTPWGRRVPFIALGAPLLSLFFVLLWFPPHDHPSWTNSIFLGLVLSCYWVAHVAVTAPYLSLMPEIVRNADERVKTSIWMGYFDILGMVLAGVGAGLLIQHGSAGIELGPLRLADGYKLTGLVAGLISLAALIVAVRSVRESPHGPSKEVGYSLWRSMAQCFRNRGFTPYILAASFFRIGVDTTVAVIPFLVVRVAGYSAGTAGALQAMIILGAAAQFPLVRRLASRFGKKALYCTGLLGFGLLLPLIYFSGSNPFLGRAVAGLLAALGSGPLSRGEITLIHFTLVFACCTFFISTFFVLPRAIFAEVIDHDESLTGLRREAIYYGIEGMSHRLAAALTPLIYTQLMAGLGQTSANPTGILLSFPVAGLALFVGFVIFLFYPFRS